MNIEEFVNNYLQEHRHDVLLNPYNGIVEFAKAFQLKMMEEAVEGVVMDFSSNQPRPQVDVYVDPNKYCTGDKVRIIVLKNTEK